MICPYCSSENPDDARFCGVCGATTESFTQQAAFDSGIPAPESAPVEAAASTPNRNKKIFIITACACAIIVIAAIAFAVVWQFIQDGNRRAAQPHKVTVSIQASGYSDSDTRIPIQVTGSTYGSSNVDELFFVNAAGEGIELPKGEYELSVPASPLTQDGILYKVPNETVSLVVPKETGDDDEVDARESSIVTMEKNTAADESDEDINKAYEYAMKDPEQTDQANQLRQKAEQVHSEAVAQQTKERKISQGLYYECPYYIIDLPESMAGQVRIEVRDQNMSFGDMPNGKWGLGYESFINTNPTGGNGSDGIDVIVYYNWSTQGDAEGVTKRCSQSGYTVEVLQWYDSYIKNNQVDKFAQYVTAL